MVQQCYAWVKDSMLPSREIELKLIETLRTITKGKIYVEVERARLTHRLAQMQEQDGDIASAAKTMQDLQGIVIIPAPIFALLYVPSHRKNFIEL